MAETERVWGGRFGANLGQQPRALYAADRGGEDLAFGLVGVEGDFGELLGAAQAGAFEQDAVGLAELGGEVAAEGCVACGA